MKIVIVGGGTAGYISAFQIKSKYPDSEITLIDSSKIGILGAGEATTPFFAQTLKKLDLPISDFVKETKATVKNGLMFVGWGTEKDRYFHPFYNYVELSYLSYLNYINLNKLAIEDYTYSKFKLEQVKDFTLIVAEGILKDGNLDKINLQTVVSKENNVIGDAHSWHIDARLLVEFFNKHAISRGIRVIDAIVDSYSTSNTGEITSIRVNDEDIKSDFVIDATGFKRLFIGNHYKAEWVGTQDTLPCDSAIAFFMDIKDSQPYSEAVAMNYGWSWRIPLQHRWGCGYVYDSKYLTETQAIDEIKEKFGKDVQIVNKFSFSSGYYSNPWINNCLAVGLASGFFEPLEGTSILNTMMSIEKFLENDIEKYVLEKDKDLPDTYNKKMSDRNKDIVDFLYLHYVTNKTNTVFWENFTKNNKMPDTVKQILEEAEQDLSIPSFVERPGKIFGWSNWITVYAGNELYNKENIKSFLDKQGEVRYTKIVEEIDNNKNLSIPLNTYLDNIINKGE